MKLAIERLTIAPQGLLPHSLRSADLEPAAWYALDEPSASVHPRLEELLGDATAVRPDVDVFYGDEVILDPAHSAETAARLKSSFDLTHLIAQDYIGWMLLVRGRRLIAYRDSARDNDLSTYGLLLHCARHDARVERIPQALSVRLAARTPLPLPVRRRLLEEWARRASPDCNFFEGLAPGSLRMQRTPADHPHVTLVIPTCQTVCDIGVDPYRGRPHILNLLESLGDTDWPLHRLSVIVGDDVDDDAVYARGWPFALRRVALSRPADAPFNYAAKMNQLWRFAQSEYLVLMHDDLIPRRCDWLEALMTFTMDPSVGGVGARLLCPNGNIQHASVAGGVMGSCTHASIDERGWKTTDGGWGEVHRESSMVRGVLFATRKSLLECMNGYDERFSVEFNDLDLCLRMRQLGLRIIYTPFAELTHFESSSGGTRLVSPLETANFLERWRGFLTEDRDYHPGIVTDTPLARAESRLDAWWLF